MKSDAHLTARQKQVAVLVAEGLSNQRIGAERGRQPDGGAEAEGGTVKHIVMFSSGIGSWAAARRLVETVGTSDVTLLFADTLIEDEDNYRFLHEAASDIGAELVIVADGRTPIEVFRDVRFSATRRVAPCRICSNSSCAALG